MPRLPRQRPEAIRARLRGELMNQTVLPELQQALAQDQRSIHEPLPARQVHLDFHTSEHIPGIGEHFSKAQFQEALQLGRVNHINIFEGGDLEG